MAAARARYILTEIGKERIQKALDKQNWSYAKAGEKLSIHRTTVGKMLRYDLPPESQGVNENTLKRLFDGLKLGSPKEEVDYFRAESATQRDKDYPLYQALLELNYEKQDLKFKKCFDKIKQNKQELKCGFFVVQGQTKISQKWLVKKLIERNLKSKTEPQTYFLRPLQKLDYYDLVNMPGSVVNKSFKIDYQLLGQIGRSFGVEINDSYVSAPDKLLEKIINRIFEKLKHSHVALVIDFDYLSLSSEPHSNKELLAKTFEEVINKDLLFFWQYLIKNQSKSKFNKNCFLMFVLDTSPRKDREVELDDWTPDLPANLPIIKPIIKSELYSWCKTHFSKFFNFPDSEARDEYAKETIERTGGVPEELIKMICESRDLEWEIVKQRWLKL